VRSPPLPADVLELNERSRSDKPSIPIELPIVITIVGCRAVSRILQDRGITGSTEFNIHERPRVSSRARANIDSPLITIARFRCTCARFSRDISRVEDSSDRRDVEERNGPMIRIKVAIRSTELTIVHSSMACLRIARS